MNRLKTLIIYYSFSGNTRKIAHAINHGMSELTVKSDIFALKGSSGIPAQKLEDLSQYDIIGFGSPVWSLSPTPNMMAVVESLPSLKGKHTFFFFLHGTMPGNSVRWMQKHLKAKCSTVIGWQDWYGSACVADIFKPYHTDGHPDEFDLIEATNFGKEMVQKSRRISDGETGLVPVLPLGKEYTQLYGRRPAYQGSYQRKDYKVRPFLLQQEIVINKKKCSNCHLCADNCPTGSLDLTANPPIDKTTCIACWVCEQLCPLGAIEIDFDSIVKQRGESSGKNWKKYKAFQKNLQRIENDPRFRSLVLVDELGKDGYWYQISKHPRIKIPPV